MAAITTTPLSKTVPVTGRSIAPSTGRKRGLRGAFFGLPYIGPVLTKATVGDPAIDHAETLNAGGVVGEGYRDSDTFMSTGGESEDVGLSSADGGDVVVVSRPTGRTAYIAKGVVGGSTPGAPIDATGRADSTGVDRFGRAKGVANAGAGLGTYDYTNFDGRATLSGDGGRALGDAGRGSMTTDGETVTQLQGRPLVSTSAASDGTVGVIDGTGQEIDIDLDDADQTGGANARVGAVVSVYKRDADDTDEDGALVGIVQAVGAGSDTIKTGAFTGLTASTTYAVYVQWLYAVPSGGRTVYATGPRSARTTLAIA